MNIIDVLTVARHKYYVTGNSDITDAEFDALETKLRLEQPDHDYFLGIGSPIRSEDKVKLPCSMGSLDQVKAGDTEKWINDNDLSDTLFALTDKLDGNSGLIVYVGGTGQIAFTRGDGVYGKDISRHAVRMNSVPIELTDPDADTTYKVVGEFIMADQVFEQVKEQLLKETGREYKNARNFVAGQLNKDIACDLFYEHCSFVAFGLRDVTMDKDNELRVLANLGFEITNYHLRHGRNIDDEYLENFVKMIKNGSKYALDGVVLDVNVAAIRQKMNEARKKTSSSLNPSSSRKFKIKDESNQAITTVRKVHWKISKNGYLKPRVEFDPIDLVGVTIQFATGFNAKFIMENKLGVGSQISITRAGDVIPFIEKVITRTTPDLTDIADMQFVYNDTDFILTEETDEQKIREIAYFFSSIGVMGLGEPSVKKMFEAEFTTIEQLINIDEYEWLDVIGKNGSKIYKSIKAKLNYIKVWDLAGSLPMFGRGVGKRKFKKIAEHWQGECVGLTMDEYCAVPGIEETTAEKIIAGNIEYHNFLDECSGMFIIDHLLDEVVTGGKLDGEYFVFTGVRDKELEAKLIAAGADVGSSMAKVTILVAKDVNGTSGKLKKVRAKNGRILSLAEAQELI